MPNEGITNLDPIKELLASERLETIGNFGLTTQDMRVLLSVLSSLDWDFLVYVSQKHLSEELKLSAKRVSESVHALISKELLIPHDRRGPRWYQLNDAFEWHRKSPYACSICKQQSKRAKVLELPSDWDYQFLCDKHDAWLANATWTLMPGNPCP